VSASGYDWQPAELGVIRSWVTKFGGNPSLGRHDAVRGCWRELAKLRERRRSGPALPVRSTRAVEQKLAEALRATGLGHHRQPGEMKVVHRYVRAYRAGRYPSMRAAAAACTRELSRTARRPRPFYGVYWLLHSTAHAMGVPKLKDEWSAAEKRVLNRHLRLLFQRRYEYARDAAQGCCRELGGSRSFKAVLFALRTEATRIGLPRFHSHVNRAE